MTTLAQSPRMPRRLPLLAAAGMLLAGVALAGAPGASAAPTTVDCSTTSLQAAINQASPGATLAVTGTCSGDYTINQNLTLVGHQTAVLDAQGSGTTLTVSPGATVQVTDLTITSGDAIDGGGVNNSGTLTLSRVLVTNSFASSGGGIFNNSSASVTLSQTTVSLNNSGGFGGGIYNNGAMTINSSTVEQNLSADGGGGIFSCCGFKPATVSNSTISGNFTAGSGGGIFNQLDSITLVNSRVAGNTAVLEAGGIDNNAGTTTLKNTTVTSNAAQSGESGTFGGGIFDFSGIVSLTGSSAVLGNSPDNCAPTGVVPGCTG